LAVAIVNDVGFLHPWNALMDRLNYLRSHGITPSAEIFKHCSADFTKAGIMKLILMTGIPHVFQVCLGDEVLGIDLILNEELNYGKADCYMLLLNSLCIILNLVPDHKNTRLISHLHDVFFVELVWVPTCKHSFNIIF